MTLLVPIAHAWRTRLEHSLPRLACSVIVALTAGAAAMPLQAADDAFPKQPIRLVLPFPPGSGTDGTARVMGNEISAATGQTVIIENKAGANGFLAAEAVAKAETDGYTLLFTSNTHIAN